MNSNREAVSIIDTSQCKAARVAGAMFLFSLMIISLNGYVFSKLIVTENVLATAHNITANEWLFRIGIINELIISVSLIVLALALYIILKPANKNLALFGLSLKLAEATIVAVIALLNFIALQILNGEVYLIAFEPEQLQALIGLFLNMHNAIYSIPMVFLGLNLVVFSCLFFKSGYIPKILAGFGIISYALVFIFALVSLLTPQYAMIILAVPSILFELIIGIWLLFKGVNV